MEFLDRSDTWKVETPPIVFLRISIPISRLPEFDLFKDEEEFIPSDNSWYFIDPIPIELIDIAVVDESLSNERPELRSAIMASDYQMWRFKPLVDFDPEMEEMMIPDLPIKDDPEDKWYMNTSEAAREASNGYILWSG